MKLQLIVNVFAAAVLLAAGQAGAQAAGSNAAEEAAIRKLIADIDKNGGAAGPIRMSDEIFWSGAYKKPVILPQTGEPKTGPTGIPNRVGQQDKSRTDVIRIVVSDSGDLAYEYSGHLLEFDLKSGQHVTVDAGILRVWQKQAGEWKVAAQFSFPYDPPR